MKSSKALFSVAVLLLSITSYAFENPSVGKLRSEFPRMAETLNEQASGVNVSGSIYQDCHMFTRTTVSTEKCREIFSSLAAPTAFKRYGRVENINLEEEVEFFLGLNHAHRFFEGPTGRTFIDSNSSPQHLIRSIVARAFVESRRTEGGYRGCATLVPIELFPNFEGAHFDYDKYIKKCVDLADVIRSFDEGDVVVGRSAQQIRDQERMNIANKTIDTKEPVSKRITVVQ